MIFKVFEEKVRHRMHVFDYHYEAENKITFGNIGYRSMDG